MSTLKYYAGGKYHIKSELPASLRPFVNHTFSSGGYAGDDFKSFNTKFKNVITKMLPEGYEIVTWVRGHYYCSAMIKTSDEKYVYISIPDVRYAVNEWFAKILYRTAANKDDWTGGPNHYTNLFTFTEDIQSLY